MFGMLAGLAAVWLFERAGGLAALCAGLALLALLTSVARDGHRDRHIPSIVLHSAAPPADPVFRGEP